MKVIGTTPIVVLDSSEHDTHEPGPEELWQESVVLLWWDPAHRVGGYYRIGHEVNRSGGPKAAGWLNVYSPQGILKKNTYLPLRPEDRGKHHFGMGDDSLRYESSDGMSWKISEQAVEAHLKVHDFHAPLDAWPKASGQATDLSANHVDLACRVTGSLRVRDKTYEVNALGYRDHGWGERKWSAFRSHRWCVASFGPELSLCAMAIQAPDDTLTKYAWIVEHDTVRYAERVEIIGHVGIDGFSVFGGVVRLQFPGGESMRFDFSPVVPTTISELHGVVASDTISEVRCGERVGVGCFEVSNNPFCGTKIPRTFERAFFENGWYDADARPLNSMR